MKSDSLVWLQAWYALQCKEIGAEENGIIIKTLEKPGWDVNINLRVTPLHSKKFHDLLIERTQHDWLQCKVQGDFFWGRCGLYNLTEVIDIFRHWALSKTPRLWSQKVTIDKTPNFKMLSLFLFREEIK